MATSSFEVEDTDEDFFDRLVNDDLDFTRYVPSGAVGTNEVDEVKAFSKLSISEVGPVGGDTGGNGSFGVNGELDHGDGVVLESSVPLQVPVVVKESESLIPDSRTEASALEDPFRDPIVVKESESLISDSRYEASQLDGKAGNGNEASALEDKIGNGNKGKALEDKEEGAVHGIVNGTGVKVVQWSSFNSDSNPSGGNSDFFSEFGDYSEDPFGNLGNTNKSWAESNVTDGVLESSGDPFANLGNAERSWAESIVTHGVLESSGDPFENLGNIGKSWTESNVTDSVLVNSVADLGASSFGQQQEGKHYGAVEEHNSDGQDLNSSQNWENLYPGWRYDPNTGQWYQLEGYDVSANTNADVNTNAYAQESLNANSQSADTVVFPDQKVDAHYLQQPGQSVTHSVAHGTETRTDSNWNQISSRNADYPAHMVFDPQYPGWYYDTIAQEWKQLESSTPSFDQSTSVEYNQQTHNTNVEYNQQTHNTNVENHGSQSQLVEQSAANWGGSMSTYDQQNASMWHPQNRSKSDTIGFTEKQQHMAQYFPTEHVTNSVSPQTAFSPSGSIALNEQASMGYDISSGVGGFESFTPAGNFSQHQSQAKEPNQVMHFSPSNFDSEKAVDFSQQPAHFSSYDIRSGVGGFGGFSPAGNFSQHQNQAKEPNQVMHFSPANFDSQKTVPFSQLPVQSGTQFSHEASAGRSSAGRPPHALVTFGFGGKLIVMKDNSSFPANLTYGSQGPVGGVVNVLNLMEVVDKPDAASFGIGGDDYFHALCQLSFPGPLVGGNAGSRELNKWIDDKIANYETPYMDFGKRDHLGLLFSLLKMACQYYGKLRSPFGADIALKETDSPESAVAKLFASAKRSNEYGALMLQNLPCEAQMQATALEVQKLLVSGRKKEALQYAQEGQLWGPALVIASQLGDQFYGDTVKHMALNQLAAGSPLRTLCLLIARQPADVFSSATTHGSLPNSTNVSQQKTQIGANYMLDDWEENLAILTANRTKDDELVIIHLGDCLWKERGQNVAAHICYLVAEANFEPYSDSARLCLIGADHLKCPRTYASPEAIQRTELYEYSRVLGNSQFLLLPFQPYKLIYAYMLAEVGKVAEALKYCQAILKSLKYGRAPEVDTWRQLVSSLEERIRAHQQGGYSTNLAPKLMGKLFTLFDNTAHRVVGGLPPPIPSTSPGHTQVPGGPSVPNSQSTMAMSPLMPSASMEPISEWTAESNQLSMPNRSISEPDLGRGPTKVDSSKIVDSSKTQEKASASSGSSRFGFGSQIFQKTLGFVTRSRSDKQAKLGEKNKFYYDEKLKRWVEEGAEPPAEEAALPPPPPTAAFQNRTQDYNINDVLKTESFHADGGQQIKSPVPPEQSSGIPPIPPSANQFSARGRTAVRSRYVDTFNKGGGTQGNLFQSPSLPSSKPGVGPSPKMFIPSPVTSYEETVQTPGESTQEPLVTNNNPPTSFNDVFSTPQTSTSSSMTMQRFPSMDNIVQKRSGEMADGNSFAPPQSRRVSSWSGSLNNANNPSMRNEIRPLGEGHGRSPLSHMSSGPPSIQSSRSGGSFGDDLHELEL